MFFRDLPLELKEQILIHLTKQEILELADPAISKYIWLRKKDRDIKDALESGNLIGLRYLVEQKLDDIYKYDYALELSVQSNYFDIVKYLVEEQNVDIHVDNNYALQISAGYGHLHIVEYLIEQGADPCADQCEPLRWSARNGHLNVVKCLIKHGAYIHVNKKYLLT